MYSLFLYFISFIPFKERLHCIAPSFYRDSIYTLMEVHVYIYTYMYVYTKDIDDI